MQPLKASELKPLIYRVATVLPPILFLLPSLGSKVGLNYLGETWKYSLFQDSRREENVQWPLHFVGKT